MKVLAAMVAVLLCGSAMLVDAADDAAAEALIKKSKCLTCHSVDKKKDGPSYKATAARLKGKPDAEQELYKHLTTNPKVKVDGQEEEHPSLKTKDEAEIRNVVQWILAQ